MGETSNSLYILKETKNPALGRNQTTVAQSQPVTTPSVSHATNVNLLTSFTNCNAYNDMLFYSEIKHCFAHLNFLYNLHSVSVYQTFSNMQFTIASKGLPVGQCDCSVVLDLVKYTSITTVLKIWINRCLV